MGNIKKLSVSSSPNTWATGLEKFPSFPRPSYRLGHFEKFLAAPTLSIGNMKKHVENILKALGLGQIEPIWPVGPRRAKRVVV